jgi:hypothetical protein
VQEILSGNKWFGSPEGEIRRASDWKGEKPESPIVAFGEDKASIAKDGANQNTENDITSRWLNETYNLTVRRVTGKQWEEVQNATGRVTWRYTETGRTKDYTEIFDAKRKYEVRLLADRMELKQDGKWSRVAKGHWDAASKNSNAGLPKQN